MYCRGRIITEGVINIKNQTHHLRCHPPEKAFSHEEKITEPIVAERGEAIFWFVTLEKYKRKTPLWVVQVPTAGLNQILDIGLGQKFWDNCAKRLNYLFPIILFGICDLCMVRTALLTYLNKSTHKFWV